MRLTAEEARARLDAEVHGVLCTLHSERGPEPQPVVYAVSGDGHIGVPIDRVKPKRSSRLQREDNLEATRVPRSSSSTGTARTGPGCGGSGPRSSTSTSRPRR